MVIDKQITNNELVFYIDIITDLYKLSNNYEKTINILKDKFNITVTLEQLEEYFSPNASEIETDLRLQFKHLGLV